MKEKKPTPKFYMSPVNEVSWKPSVLINEASDSTQNSQPAFPAIDFRAPHRFSIPDYMEKHGLTGMLFHDKNGSQVKSAHALQKLYFNSKNQLLFKDIESLWKAKWTVTDRNGRSVPYENSTFMKALRTGRTCQKLLHIAVTGGEQCWFYFHSQPFHSGTESDYVVTTIIDISNEKILIDKATAKETMLQSFMKQVPSLSWIINEHGDLLYANAAFYNYFGLKEKSSIGKKLSELVPLAISNKLYNKHIKVYNTGRPIQTTEQVELADGNSFEAFIDIFLLQGPDGEKLIAGQSLHLPDKSKGKLNELKSKKLLMLNHAISDAIWEWDMKSGHIYRNESLMKMIGFKEELFSGLLWWLRHIHPDDRKRIAAKVKEVAIKHEPSWQEQYRFKCADGRYKHVQDRGYVIYENGVAVRMIGSLTDLAR
jgi:PAS domain S-box-containing protein